MDGYVMVQSVEEDDPSQCSSSSCSTSSSNLENSNNNMATLHTIRRRHRMDCGHHGHLNYTFLRDPNDDEFQFNPKDHDPHEIYFSGDPNSEEDEDHRHRMTCMKEIILQQFYKNGISSSDSFMSSQSFSREGSSGENSPKKMNKKEQCFSSSADASSRIPAQDDDSQGSSFEPFNTILSEEPFENNIRNTIAFTSMVGEGESESSEEFSIQLEKMSNSDSGTCPLEMSHATHHHPILDTHQTSVGQDLLKHPLCEHPKVLSDELFSEGQRPMNGIPSSVLESNGCDPHHHHHHHHGHHQKGHFNHGIIESTTITPAIASSTLLAISKVREQIRNEILLSRLSSEYESDSYGHKISRGYNLVLAGCSQSGKSQLKSLLCSIMNFENHLKHESPETFTCHETSTDFNSFHHTIHDPHSEEDDLKHSLPIFKNLDHTTRTRCLVQDSIPFRCSVKPFNAKNGNSSSNNSSKRNNGDMETSFLMDTQKEMTFMFSDLPGVNIEKQLNAYMNMLTALYMGTYGEDDFVTSFDMDSESKLFSNNCFLENRRSYNKIKREYHHLIVLTIPIMFTELELKLIQSIQQHLDEKSIPYLIVATKTDLLVDGHHSGMVTNSMKTPVVTDSSASVQKQQQWIEMKKQEIARALGMRSFDILTIGMSDEKGHEGLRDFETIHPDLYHQSMVLLRQIILHCHRVRNNEIRMGWIEWFVFWLCLWVVGNVRSLTLMMQWCWKAHEPCMMIRQETAQAIQEQKENSKTISTQTIEKDPCFESDPSNAKTTITNGTCSQKQCLSSKLTKNEKEEIDLNVKEVDRQDEQRSNGPSNLNAVKTEPVHSPTITRNEQEEEINQKEEVVTTTTTDESSACQESCRQEAKKKRKFHRLEKRILYNRIFQATVLTMLAILMFQTLMVFLVV